jgi:hypothetical protein
MKNILRIFYSSLIVKVSFRNHRKISKSLLDLQNHSKTYFILFRIRKKCHSSARNLLSTTLYGIFSDMVHTRVYPKVSGVAAWRENCKWYSSLPLGAVVSLFCESV